MASDVYGSPGAEEDPVVNRPSERHRESDPFEVEDLGGTMRPPRRARSSLAHTDPVNEVDGVAVAASTEPSADELAIRRHAIVLVGKHWEELSRRLAGWLGQACRNDDSLPGQVALVMIQRYRNGNGSLVGYLHRNPQSTPAEDKQVLFGEAKLVYHEVLPAAIRERDNAKLRTELDSNTASPTCSDPSATFDFVSDDPRWALDATTQPVTSGPVNIEPFIEAIEVLLTRGEQVWESLCDEGLLDRVAWTRDQKWAAIGMMWQFSVEQIAVIRQVKAQTPGHIATNEAATRQMMSTIRRKGRRLLAAMSPADRREHDLRGRRRRSGADHDS